MTPRRLPSSPRRGQRGIAALIVVMVLFFVVSMVAAYTSRNLIFEQRTSVNQYASTQALEAAEAGLEWALSMANSGRIGADCGTSLNPADTTFRDRYLNVDAAGVMTARAAAATCVWNGAGWDCACPDAGNALPAAPVGAGTFPAFRVRFVTVTTQPRVIRLESSGCTRLDTACLGFGGQGLAGEGQAVVRSLVAMVSALPRPPAAALTLRGNLPGPTALTLANTDPAANGITLQAGGPIVDTSAPMTLVSLPGMPPTESVLENDAGAQAPSSERFFASFFNQWPETHALQPTAIDIDCSTGCNANDVRLRARLNPGRPLWLRGDLDLDGGGDIGSANDPVVLVVDGQLRISAPVDVYGLVYVRRADWSASVGGGGTVRGAVVAEGDVTVTGASTFVYDRAILDRLRQTTGSIVRVPGGWRDY